MVTIYQVGQERGVPFLAQELLTGEMLDDVLSGNRRDWRRRSAWVAKSRWGWRPRTEHGLLHRDIKP